MPTPNVTMSPTQTHENAELHTEKPAAPTTSPRKRRRRAPATGAADDCFACQERSTKCDRRRPYCTPCLEVGKDCSGYKTALTWGVGSASRGKLRGLSLPIASSKRAAQSSPEDDEKTASAPRKLAKLGSTRSVPDSRSTDQFRPSSRPTSSRGIIPSNSATPTTYGFVNMDPTTGSSTTSPMLPPPSFEWRNPTSLSQNRSSRHVQKKLRRHTLEPLQVQQMHPARDYGVMPMTASVVGGYGHRDFGLSSQISPMVPSFTGYGIVSPSYKDFDQHSLMNSPCESNFFTGGDNLGWSGDSMGSSVSSDGSSQDLTEGLQTFYGGMDNFLSPQPPFQSNNTLIVTSAPDVSSVMIDSKFPSLKSESQTLVPDDVGDHSLIIPRQFPSLSIGNTPKLQFLIDYYDKVISPVIVAFDGPTNPYRSHILSLAVESETLQHAIAALSASNLRMRRSQNPTSTNRSTQSNADSSHDHSVRRSSFAHSLMDASVQQLPQTSTNEPSNDELYHKNASIKALNKQLADPNRRKDDSILATLLILCLYHICDTGVAKFKTQFAGVKKILALRGGTKGHNSKATNWLTIMFTWFDAMTATVNDREGQLEFDMSRLNGDEWALENLAGCDGRLFKVIAKLGRLNLLSQNKPVVEDSPQTSPTTKVQPLPSQDYYSMSHNRFDGNGWSTIPDDLALETDTRAQFWREWTDIRRRLHEWQLEDSVRAPSGVSRSRGDQQDLLHISESFRYSALLYTERLAYPHLPSVHPNFQNLVTQALFHISNVKSDVFLLWPLFITGTECVSEQGRYLIRERCLDIQKDSGFFNNISGLELLEKVWRDDEGSDEGLPLTATGMGVNEYSSLGSGGFRWRRAMDRVDGEYIVV